MCDLWKESEWKYNLTYDDLKCPGLLEDDETERAPLRFENEGYLEEFEDKCEEPVIQKTHVNEKINIELVPMFCAEPVNQDSHVNQSINSFNTATSQIKISQEQTRKWDRDHIID